MCLRARCRWIRCWRRLNSFLLRTIIVTGCFCCGLRVIVPFRKVSKPVTIITRNSFVIPTVIIMPLIQLKTGMGIQLVTNLIRLCRFLSTTVVGVLTERNRHIKHIQSTLLHVPTVIIMPLIQRKTGMRIQLVANCIRLCRFLSTTVVGVLTERNKHIKHIQSTLLHVPTVIIMPLIQRKTGMRIQLVADIIRLCRFQQHAGTARLPAQFFGGINQQYRNALATISRVHIQIIQQPQPFHTGRGEQRVQLHKAPQQTIFTCCHKNFRIIIGYPLLQKSRSLFGCRHLLVKISVPLKQPC
jgi:hypothetical protein